MISWPFGLYEGEPTRFSYEVSAGWDAMSVSVLLPAFSLKPDLAERWTPPNLGGARRRARTSAVTT